jgi:predicted O-methyltransferase YrrM
MGVAVRKSLEISDKLMGYLHSVSLKESEVAARLREETAGLPSANMQIAPEQGQFMAWLLEVMEARQVLEVGTFTGYSALVMASAIGAAGKVTTLDVSPEWTAIARRYWHEAGVAERIELKLGPAAETLKTLTGPYDFAFIDADKTNYTVYYEAVLPLVRTGGVIAIDNVLWSGRVADPTDSTPETDALRKLNLHIQKDERVTMSLLAIGDGMTLCRKRA